MAKLRFFIVILQLILLLHSCEKERENIVPYVRVYVVLNIQTDLANLGVLQTAEIIPANNNQSGILEFSSEKLPDIPVSYPVYGNGLLIYRISLTDFIAYDRTCTYKAQTEYCAVDPDDTGLLPECPCCGSRYVIPNNAFPDQGPASLPLKQYNTSIRNGMLYIRN